MRRTLLRERLYFSMEVLEFCLYNPTVSDWLKAVGIQSRLLIECVQSQFDSIESLLSSEQRFLHELLAPHNIHQTDRDLFLSSWQFLQSFSSPDCQLSLSIYHFSWTESCDRMRSHQISSSLFANGPPSDSQFVYPPRRVPSPDPWTGSKSFYPQNMTLASVSDATSNSDPNIYPLTPSPGPPSALGRVFGINNHTFPRRHKPSPPEQQEVPPPDSTEPYFSEDNTPTPRSFIGSRLLRRIFRPRNIFRRSYAHQQQGRGSRNSLIVEYKQEPRTFRYKHPLEASPDNDSGSHSRLHNQIQDEVFVDDLPHSPSYPSDTGHTDGSGSPLQVSSSPQPTDWEINFQEIRNIREIRSCKFSSLATGNWHGQVMLKTYRGSLPFVRDHFQQELSVLRNIRHDNVILFRGACTGDPDLTIVTSVKHAPTLHSVIRLSPKHPLDRALTILKEISQAMTYLHDRRIVHQNLTTDSIYLERSNAKPILFDIAINPLLEYAGTDSGSWEFPRGYVSCMAPEIAESLSLADDEFDRILPFSDKSDVFAFGSIWYELYTGQYPLQGDPIEVVLYKVSNGVRQTLDLIIGPRGIKEELYHCWHRDPHKRPSFNSLEGIIEKLPNLQQPKKLPTRSTSHSAVMPLKSSEATM